MKRIFPFIVLIAICNAGFAQKTLTDSIIDARDYLATKIVFSYLQARIDGGNIDSAEKSNYSNIIKYNDNSLSKPILNKELDSLLKKYGYSNTATSFLPKVKAIIHIEQDRNKIPEKLINAIFKCQSVVLTKNIISKEDLKNEITTYFNPQATGGIIGTHSTQQTVASQKLPGADKKFDSLSIKYKELEDGAINPTEYHAYQIAAIVLLVIAIIFLYMYFRIKKNSSNDNGNTQFFMGLPDPETKFFLGGSKTDIFIKGKSVFIFTYTNSNKKIAEFELVLDDDATKLVKGNRNIVKYVCNPPINENEWKKISRLINIEKGTVQLDKNRNWTVPKKAIIDFVLEENIKSPAAVPQTDSNAMRNNVSHLPATETKTEEKREEAISLPLNGKVNSKPDKSKKPSFQLPKFYMGLPENEYFPGYVKFEFHKPGITFFEFSPISDKEATFTMKQDEETLRFVKNTYIDKIKPACKLSNTPTIETSKIITDDEGLVKLDGDNWQIITQATITFK